MATFSVNQARQLFVGNSIAAGDTAAAIKTAFEAGGAGMIAIPFAASAGSEFYVLAKTGLGETLRSDLVKSANVESISLTAAASLIDKKKVHTITLNSEILNSDSKVPAGYDYILRMSFSHFIGMTEDDTYYKYGQVYPTSAMTASDFYKAMALSIAKNISKDSKLNTLVDIALGTASDDVPVTPDTKAASLTGTYTSIKLSEAVQEWHLGTMQAEVIPFTVAGLPVRINGIDLGWLVDSVSLVNATSVNGQKIADLEYFCMGERGDIYRNIGWPNVVPTKYLVNPASNYDVVDVQFYWAGDAEDVQKSPRTLTLVVPAGSGSTLATKLSTITGIAVSQRVTA